MRNNRGLTLMSTVVAIALTGIVAAAGMQLVNHQMTATGMAEVIAKRAAILNFYSDLLRDDKVWSCSLNHKIGSTFTNAALRDYVVKLDSTVIQGDLALIAPDCTTVMIESSGRTLGKSMTTAAVNGWWDVKITWQGMGKGAVDLKLEVAIDRNKFNLQHGFKLDQSMKTQMIKEHRSENSTQNPSCVGVGYEEAVTGINLHTASSNRRVNCSGANYRIVQLANRAGCTPPHLVENIDSRGNIICSTGIGVKPSAPLNNTAINGLDTTGDFTRDANRSFIERKDCSPGVIDRIGADGSVTCVSPPKGPDGPPGCDWPTTRVSPSGNEVGACAFAGRTRMCESSVCCRTGICKESLSACSADQDKGCDCTFRSGEETYCGCNAGSHPICTGAVILKPMEAVYGGFDY